DVTWLVARFVLEWFAGGFVVSTFLVFWFGRRFGASAELMGLVLFCSGLLQAAPSVAACARATRAPPPAVERPADPDPGDADPRLGDRDAVAALDTVADGRPGSTGLRHRAGRSQGTHRRGGVHEHRALRGTSLRRSRRGPAHAVGRGRCAVRGGGGLEEPVRRAGVRAVPAGAAPRGASPGANGTREGAPGGTTGAGGR